jgi:hypothetical protein
VSRDIPTALADALDEPVVRPFLAVRVELPDPVYAWTGIGTITFDDADGTSRDWQGVGGIAAVDTIGEATDGSATGVKCSLFQVPSEFRDDIEAQAVRGAIMELYVGTLNETFQQVDASVLIWKGRLDQYRITDGGATLTVEITGESRAIDQRRPAIKRFTDEWQQRKYPGDLFFQYVPQMTEVQILWAKAEQSGAMPVSKGSVSGGNLDRAGGPIRDF